MMKSRLLVALIFIGSIAGCAKDQPVSLPYLQPEFSPYSETIDDVTLSVKVFSAGDSKRYFDRDVIAKGYQPIQITVNNDTDGYLLFSSQGISVPTIPAAEVAEKVHTSTVGRSAAYGVAGLFIWPLLIPAVVDGVGSSNANQELDRDFSAKAAGEVVIQPYATHNGIIFVPTSEYRDTFNIRLVERKTKKKYQFRVHAMPPA